MLRDLLTVVYVFIVLRIEVSCIERDHHVHGEESYHKVQNA